MTQKPTYFTWEPSQPFFGLFLAAFWSEDPAGVLSSHLHAGFQAPDLRILKILMDFVKKLTALLLKWRSWRRGKGNSDLVKIYPSHPSKVLEIKRYPTPMDSMLARRVSFILLRNRPPGCIYKFWASVFFSFAKSGHK